jgi:hypothetical protein
VEGKKMKANSSSIKVFIASILIASILLIGFPRPVFAQRSRPIVITFGQPNIWSLEQAHYLLARMHRQNLDLQTAALGSLDPNATNASRIEILKTLLQAGASFDQAVGVNNSLLRRDKTFNADRRRELLTNRSTLQTESTQLARDIAALKIQKSQASTEPEKTQIQESIDAKTEEKAAVDNELSQTNDEVKNLTSASGDFQSAKVPDFSPSDIKGDLDSLIDKVQLVNPSIAATLRLDNHIQMQYEIISKQLTLLRDEVGPGERLVFLELPQSINATQDNAENKMAQTWWRIAGYTTLDRPSQLLKELQDLFAEIGVIENKIREVEQQGNWTTVNLTNQHQLKNQLEELCKRKAEREVELNQAKERLKKLNEPGRKPTPEEEEVLCKQLIHDLEDLRKEIEGIDDSIARTRQAIMKIDDQEIKLKNERARLSQAFTSLSTKYNKLQVEQVRNEVRRQQDVADRLLQRGSADTKTVVDETFRLLSDYYGFAQAEYKKNPSVNAKCTPLEVRDQSQKNYQQLKAIAMGCQPREFIDLEEPLPAVDKRGNYIETPVAQLKQRSVRTIDIIPRQNAINVQDTKQRVARTGIFAAFSFLFGFAGKFSYERQREQAEQFLNQELFTSGFGKGEKDFGWSFFPFAGTKQLSSGIRTTYAIAIVPDDAESLVLKARGCYFPRKENQPLNYNTTRSPKWIDDRSASKGMCTPSEQVFVVPIPGGSGDGADYYITEIRYSPTQEPGSRMVASIRGQNLPSQLGVFIDGVPLREAVGLGQLNIESILDNDKTKDNCVGPICGRFERIDANEVVVSFQTGPDFVGTPRIGLIGPGKSVELNKLNLTVNGQEDTQLASAEQMFGDPPDKTLRRIVDFKVAPTPPPNTAMRGVLSGSRFKPDDRIFVNGALAAKTSDCRTDLCIVRFPPQQTDYLTVTISPAIGDEKAVSKTFINPTNLSIISASVVSYELEEASHPAILSVKLDGSGFREDLDVRIIKSEGPPDIPKRIVASAGQMFLKVAKPEAVVHISVTDPANNREVSAIVVRPEPPPKDKK